MSTVQTTAQNPDFISIGSAKIEVQSYTDDPDIDVWTDLGLADDIEVSVERVFASAEPGNGVNPIPLVVNETATVSFALWEQYFDNLTLLDGGLSKTTNGKVRTMGGAGEFSRVRMRLTQLIPRNNGTQDTRRLTLYYGKLNGNESFQFKNRTETDPFNRKTIKMLFELDPDRTAEDRDELLKEELIEQYLITFDSQEGSAVASETVTDDDGTGALVAEPEDPTRAEYTFDGWFTAATGGSAWTFATDLATDDTTIYAQWTIVT
jgi:uncharacterized repeat protein (TIGR02543 family)